jgi:hypothetical protein
MSRIIVFLSVLTSLLFCENFFAKNHIVFSKDNLFLSDFKLIKHSLPDDKSRIPLYGYTLIFNQTPIRTFYATEVKTVYFGDIDHDGVKEAVMLAKNHNTAEAFWVLFTNYSLKFLPVWFETSHEVTDLDGDGNEELIISSVDFGLNGALSLADITSIELPVNYRYENFWLRKDLVEKLYALPEACTSFDMRKRLHISLTHEDNIELDYGSDVAECVVTPFVAALYAGDRQKAKSALSRAVFENEKTRFVFVSSIVNDLFKSPFISQIASSFHISFKNTPPSAQVFTQKLLHVLYRAKH